MSEMINQAHLDMLKEVIGDDLKEIIETFLATAPEIVTHIQTAFNQGAADDLRLHAHTLKGSASNIGATQLSELSLVAENHAKSGDVKAAATDCFHARLSESFLGRYYALSSH